MRKFINQVREFQEACGQEVNNSPMNLGAKDVRLRDLLINEERIEYFHSAMNGDIVETLDALVDMAYILFGTINSHGMQEVFEEAFNRVHANNMTKVVDGKVIRGENGKILKPDGFIPVSLEDLV